MLKMLSALVIATGFAFSSTAFAANTTLTANNTVAADVYTASDLGISFALNIPTDSDDLYFSLTGPGDGSWLAIGLGSDRMANALMMIAYPTSNGTGVTVSPRLGTGHTEPTVAPNVTVELLPGSGVVPDATNNTLTVNARCINCRSWSGGSIDVTSKAQKMIFAYGPWVGNPNSVNADLRMHYTDGVFTMDMTKAAGLGGLPDVSDSNSGATEVSIASSHDITSPAHACIMVFTFVGLMPLGTLMLRVLGWNRIHGINQTFASILGIIGAGLGIYTGTLYNRSKKFNSGHQVFGILIIIAMLIQLVLGIMHHRIFKQTQQPTKLAPIHVWLGRIVIICGVANGFLGFPLALATHYNYVLLALALLFGIPTILILFWKARRAARKAREADSNNGRSESPKLFASEAFGTNIRMENMGSSSHYGQPVVEPWSRV